MSNDSSGTLLEDVRKQLTRGGLESLFVKTAGAALLFTMNVVLARSLSTHDFGLVSVGITVANFAAIAAALGIPNATLRFVSQFAVQSRWGALRSFLRHAGLTLLGTSLTAAILLTLVPLWLSIDDSLRASCAIAGLILVPLIFTTWLDRVVRAFGRILHSLLPEELVVPGAVIVACLLSGMMVSVRYVAGAFFVGWVLAFAIAILFTQRASPIQYRVTRVAGPSEPWFAVARASFVGTLMQAIILRADLLVLGALVSMNDAGVYAAALRVAMLCTFPLMIIDNVAAPMMASLHHSGRLEELRTTFANARLVSLLGTIPLAAVILVAPEIPLKLFGSYFEEASLMLRILVVGQVVNAATGPVSFALLMTGMERAFSRIMLAGAALAIVGMLLLIPKFGGTGAAVVQAAVISLVNLTMWLKVRHIWAR